MKQIKKAEPKIQTQTISRDEIHMYSSEILNKLPVIFFLSNASGKVVYFNPRWYEFTGTSERPDYMLSYIIHPSDMKKFSAFLKHHPEEIIELRIKAKSGKYKWVSMKTSALAGDTKNTKWLTKVLDIDKQKETETSLNLHNANEEALMESLGEAVLATDVDEHIVFANASAEDMFGFKQNEMIGMLFSELFVLHDKLGASFSPRDFLIPQVLRTGKKATASSLYYTTAHRKKFPASVTTSPIRMDGHTVGTISIFRNTRKEAQIDKAKTEFVSLASHQLRTPLTAIKLFTEMLLSDQSTKRNLEQRDILENIERSNEKMIRLVDNLLDVANMEAGRMWVEPVLLSPSETINSILAEATPLSLSRGITLIYKDNQKDMTEIDTDPYLLRQILNNIITNAIEYSKKNTKVIVRVIWQDDTCIFSVQDHGIGITKKAQREIFNRFFRAENAIKFKTESSGLGLYVCKMMVEALGGKITFKTEVQKGTTFFVHIPIKSPEIDPKKFARLD